MRSDRKREAWTSDIDARQRNVVFPDTVQNEARFWRNIGNQPWTTSTKIGLGILGLFVYGFLVTVLIASFREGDGWRLVLGIVIFVGTAHGIISWAAREPCGESRRSGQRASVVGEDSNSAASRKSHVP